MNYLISVRRTILLDTDFPKIVCLCGSTRFWREYQKQMLRLTVKGVIYLSSGAATGTDDEHFGNLPKTEWDAIKTNLDELHKRKIDLADEILVLNCPIPYCNACQEFRLKVLGCSGEHAFDGTMKPYIGDSTRSEIEYALSKGKVVRYLMEDGNGK